MLDLGYKQKNKTMNSIEAVRDAIETLSTDEKIDEGQYLALMNHLKKVYEQIERSERKEDIPVFNTSAQRAMALWEQQQETGLSDITLQLSKTSLWYGPWHTILRNEENVTAIRIICDGIRNPDTFRQQDLEEIPKNVIRLLYDMPSEDWASPEVREIILSNYTVRRQNITFNLCFKRINSYTSSHSIFPSNTDEWTALLHDNPIVPFKTLKKMNRRREMVDRAPRDIKKLHPITLCFNIPNHQVNDIHLYTNRIQLGRSNINPLLCELLISLIHQEAWTDVPMDYLIMAKQMVKITTPIMVVSGITATTRNKHRSYVCCNGMIIIRYDKGVVR